MDAVFVNGTVGSGKTTLAAALSSLETSKHATIDLDEIARLSAATTADPFNHELELENLRSMAANFRRAGAERFILSGVLEAKSEVARYVDALGVNAMFICRLVVRPDVNAARLTRRHAGDPDGLAWHLRRLGELAQILEKAAIEDLILDSSDATPHDLAQEVRRAAGWAPHP